MGWMPGPVELCIWPSLWMFSRAKETDHTASLKEAEFLIIVQSTDQEIYL